MSEKGRSGLADNQTFDWHATLRSRLPIGAAILLVWAVAIEARLVHLQVFQHEALAARARRQQQRTAETLPNRGDIVDRNGRVLAYSVDTESVYAVPGDIDDPAAVVSAICGALADCDAAERRRLVERLSGDGAFAYVRRQVPPDQARRVKVLELDGIGFLTESRRFYPNRELAAHVLGYVGVDNVGLSGIEASYDEEIRGKKGSTLIQTDARHRPFGSVDRPPTAGATLQLTLDTQLQHIAERELRLGVRANRARGGAAVLMDPWTGEILALASYPTFNPNLFQDAQPGARRNRAVDELYEPGSTFKVVTASAALEQGVVHPGDMIDVRGGRIRFGSRVISDTHDYGVLSFNDVIVKSSNVGAIKVGLQLGPERMVEYVRRFGFGRPSSPDFPGESAGIVWSPAKLTDSALASVSMGYQVGVTPLQMAAAVSSVANGGELIVPRVVRSIVRDGQRVPVERKVLRRTVTPDVASQLTAIMEDVVQQGTGEPASLEHYSVAGKTGTAARLVDGRYSRSEYNASFVGFVPSRRPAFTLIVVIDSPRGPAGYFGGTVAGPVFKRIADAALRHYGITPNIHPETPVMVARGDSEVPDVAPRPVSAIIFDESRPRPAADGRDGFPDVRGLSARDALHLLANLGVTAELRGSGVVVRQGHEPGTDLSGVSTVVLELAREQPRRAEGDSVPSGAMP